MKNLKYFRVKPSKLVLFYGILFLLILFNVEPVISEEQLLLKRGVNLAGAEFTPETLPGKYGIQYIYPTAEELDYYKSKGLTIIRLPFRWERMQLNLFSELEQAELQRMDNFIAAARSRGLKVVLDPHNYGRYYQALICSNSVPCEAFSNFWRRLAEHYKDEEAIYAYGLMNEPHDTGGLWRQAAQAGINGIRSVDDKHMILVPGDGWSSAYRWTEFNNDFKVTDNNFMYEAHLYFDSDGSGKYKDSYEKDGAYPEIGIDRVKVSNSRPFDL